MAASSQNAHKKLATNRKAFRDYFVVEKYEAGIELRGTEVKSVREGHISLIGAFARVENGELFLNGMNIQPYKYGNRFNHDPDRPRRLLLHRKEITLLQKRTEQKGQALIPLSVYMKRGRVKVEIGLCKGKTHGDKRETLRRKTADREAERAIKDARGGR